MPVRKKERKAQYALRYLKASDLIALIILLVGPNNPTLSAQIILITSMTQYSLFLLMIGIARTSAVLPLRGNQWTSWLSLIIMLYFNNHAK